MLVTNDVHSRVLTSWGLVQAVAEAHDAGTIVADSGDFFGGSSEFELYQGTPERQVLRAYYDVVAPGNHFFSLYESLASDSDGPVVIQSNLLGWDGPRWWEPEGTGLLIAAVMSRQCFESIDTPTDRYGFVDPVSSVLEALERCSSTGARLVVLSHQGFTEDVATVDELVACGARPLVFFSGHCHSPSAVESRGGVPVVVASAEGRAASCFDVHDGAVSVIPLTAPALPHPSIRSMVEAMARDSSCEPTVRIVVPIAAVASPRAITSWLVGHLHEIDSRVAALNLRAVKCDLVADYPWCSPASFVKCLPYDNDLVEVTLKVPVRQAAEALFGAFDEELLVEGPSDETSVTTTSYIADRFARLGLLQSRSLPHSSLRQLARAALLDSEAVDPISAWE